MEPAWIILNKWWFKGQRDEEEVIKESLIKKQKVALSERGPAVVYIHF